MWAAISSFLMVMVKPVLTQLVIALGVGVVSYTGYSVAITQLTDTITNNYNGLPVVALNIMNLFGVDSAIGIIVSTAISLAAFTALTAGTKLSFKSVGASTGKVL